MNWAMLGLGIALAPYAFFMVLRLVDGPPKKKEKARAMPEPSPYRKPAAGLPVDPFKSPAEEQLVVEYGGKSLKYTRILPFVTMKNDACRFCSKYSTRKLPNGDTSLATIVDREPRCTGEAGTCPARPHHHCRCGGCNRDWIEATADDADLLSEVARGIATDESQRGN